jgi:hypothetical protein
MVTYVDFFKLISIFCLIMCEFQVFVLIHKIFLFQMKFKKVRNVLVAFKYYMI